MLRSVLREGGAEFKVVKMTLAKRAAAELEYTDLDELLLGPTGLAFADGDPVTAAKALKDFAKENDAFSVKGGMLGSEFLTPERVSELAEIESRDVLLSKIAGVMQAPMANMAGLLAALPRNLATALQQLVEKKEAAGDTGPAADSTTEPEPGDEEAAGEAVAAEATSDPEEPEATAETEDAEDAPEAAAEEAPAEEASADDVSTEDETSDDEADDDGDDAKSNDKDPAAEAEEA